MLHYILFTAIQERMPGARKPKDIGKWRAYQQRMMGFRTCSLRWKIWFMYLIRTRPGRMRCQKWLESGWSSCTWWLRRTVRMRRSEKKESKKLSIQRRTPSLGNLEFNIFSIILVSSACEVLLVPMLVVEVNSFARLTRPSAFFRHVREFALVSLISTLLSWIPMKVDRAAAWSSVSRCFVTLSLALVWKRTFLVLTSAFRLLRFQFSKLGSPLHSSLL